MGEKVEVARVEGNSNKQTSDTHRDTVIAVVRYRNVFALIFIYAVY